MFHGFSGEMYRLATINASDIQGSAIGPAAFIVAASDLTTAAPSSEMSKYADDVILHIPSSDITTCENEIRNIEL